MPPSFVGRLLALLLFGPNAAMLVAVAGTIIEGLQTHSTRIPCAACCERRDRHGRDSGRRFRTPLARWHAGPLHVAVAGGADRRRCCRVLLRQERFRGCDSAARHQTAPQSIVAETRSPGLPDLLHRSERRRRARRGGRSPDLGGLAVAALPLYFAYRAYADYVRRLEDEHHRREVIESLDEGMSVVDGDGRVTLWNDALERIVGCPRERALGPFTRWRSAGARPTELPRAIDDALTTGARGRWCSACRSAADARILQVKILPVDGGVTLIWYDVTERTRAEQHSSEARSGSRWRRKAPTTVCGSGIFERRSSTSRPDGGR